MKDERGNTVYFGVYRGRVVNNKDPKKMGRLKIHVAEVYGDDPSPWAFPTGGAFAGSNSGDFIVPAIGDWVRVEFEAGDACRPIWSGRWWPENSIPDVARGVSDESAKADPSVVAKGKDSIKTANDDVLTEPPSPYAAVYPDNKVIRTRRGLLIELDDTAGHERIHIWHPSGSWIEMHPDGTVVVHAAGSQWLTVEGDYNMHVKGDMNVVVEGSATQRVNGDSAYWINGERVEFFGKSREAVVAQDDTRVVVRNVNEANWGKKSVYTKGAVSIAGAPIDTVSRKA